MAINFYAIYQKYLPQFVDIRFIFSILNCHYRKFFGKTKKNYPTGNLYLPGNTIVH